METHIVRDRAGTAVEAGPHEGQTVTAVSQARDAINLRLLLELRRRLKAAAERELAVAADRMRSLRTELRRAEAELRLNVRSLHTRARQLAATASRMQNAQARASGARTRLCALEQEHQDLAQQLAEAHQDADKLQHSVRACQPHRNGTLDSLVLATRALINDLEQATRDEAGLRQRGRDLIDESEVFTARCEALHKCFTAAEKATSSICGEIDAALNGLPERARPRASQAPHTAQGGGT